MRNRKTTYLRSRKLVIGKRTYFRFPFCNKVWKQ